MVEKLKFSVKPLEHIYELSRPPLNMPYLAADWPSMNVMVNSHRIQKRWGYKADRDLGDDAQIQHIIGYTLANQTTKNILFLTDKDLCLRETGDSKTFSYRTEVQTYTGTEQVDAIDASTKLVVTFEAGTTLENDGITTYDVDGVGDYFILDEDHSSDVEPDADWREIKSVDSDTQLTLRTAYGKAITSPGAKNATIRKIYSVPSRERWAWAIVGDKFCFTNGNVPVLQWDGTASKASALQSGSAVANKARYCLPYAQRLLIADIEISSTREPWTLAWCKSGDPTTWGDGLTSGSIDFLDTESKITGLGRVGNNVLVYKKDSIIFGYRTGIANDPFTFPTEKRGVGLYAPHSLVHFLGTNAFLGMDDFYIIDGDHPVPIGEPIRAKFFDIVPTAEVQHVWGVISHQYNEILWFANTKEGTFVFVWDWKDKTWTTYDLFHDITGFGETL